MSLKRTLVLLLSAVLLLCLAACNTTEPPVDTTTPADTEQPAPPAEPVLLYEGGASDYTIVVSGEKSEYYSVAQTFKDMFSEATGIELDIKTDLEAEASACEIVIGETNRAGTSLTDAIKSDIYRDGYIITVVGGRLWISGENSYSTLLAVQYFAESYLAEASLTLEGDFCYIQKRGTPAEVASVTIAGNNLSEYVICCDKSDKDVLSLAEELQTFLWERAGRYLSIVESSGDGKRSICFILDESSSAPTYTVKTHGGDLLLSGSDLECLGETYDYILREYFGRRSYFAGSYFEDMSENIALGEVNATVSYNRIDTLTLAGRNISEYVITYDPENSTASTAYAAEELKSFLYKTTGVELTVEKTNALLNKPQIRLVYDKAMGENYSLKTSDGGLTISGGERGVLYGAYNFLEDYVGWAFLPYNTDVLLNEQKTVSIDEIDVDYTQYFEYRAPHFYASFNGSFSAKNMINHYFGRSVSDVFGGWYGFTGGHAHTLMKLLGDDSYQSSIGENPCISDEDNVATVISNVRKILEGSPSAQIISVSATDSMKFCQCDGCTGKSIGGNQTDAYIKFINRVAEAIEDDYPNVKLHMLGYGHTYEPPTKIMPKDNIIVQLADMGCCFQHPLADECCETNKKFMSSLKAWSEVTDNLYMWDYATNFLYFFTTFPNFNVLRENIKTFYEYGVKGVYEQGDCNNFFAKFEDLETYLIAKIMENPYMSDEEYDALIDKYMRGYYGEGWEYIRAYYDFLMESASKKNHYGIYAQPDYMYDEKDFILRGAEVDSWFDAAEKAATRDNILHHIRALRISYSYMKLYLSYSYVRRVGTAEQVAALYAECEATFDDMCRETYRLVDIHAPLGNYVDQVSKTAHPQKWCVTEHKYSGNPSGVSGADATGDVIYG